MLSRAVETELVADQDIPTTDAGLPLRVALV